MGVPENVRVLAGEKSVSELAQMVTDQTAALEVALERHRAACGEERIASANKQAIDNELRQTAAALQFKLERISR